MSASRPDRRARADQFIVAFCLIHTMPMARKSAKLFFVACGRQAAKKSWNFLRWGSYCHCAEHESVNLIVCLSAVTCLVHTARPSGVVVSERVDHARMQTQMRAHRLFGEVDQRGGSGVDQGGSGWIRGGSSTFPGSGPSRTLGKRGKQRMAAGPAAGGTCAFIKLKEKNAVSVVRRNVERREERCFSRIL